jgi:hypothetical protein
MRSSGGFTVQPRKMRAPDDPPRLRLQRLGALARRGDRAHDRQNILDGQPLSPDHAKAGGSTMMQ